MKQLAFATFFLSEFEFLIPSSTFVIGRVEIVTGKSIGSFIHSCKDDKTVDLKMYQRKLSIATGFLVLPYTDAFWSMPGPIPVAAPSTSSFLGMVPPDAPAGSFFHKVPDEGERPNPTSQPINDINDEVAELLRKRRKPPRASRPSTIGGVPTAKATGKFDGKARQWGKDLQKISISSRSFFSII